MTNEQIAASIKNLQDEFEGNYFIMTQRNKKILAEITALRNQCTHSDGAVNFAATKGKCIYCGRDFADE